MPKEKRATIFLGLILLMLAFLFVLSILSSFLGSKALFIPAAFLDAIKIPSLLFFGLGIATYTGGVLHQHKKEAITKALMAALVFLAVEVLVNFTGSILVSLTRSNIALMEGVLTAFKGVLWVGLFFWAMQKIVFNTQGIKTKKPRGIQIAMLIVVCLWVVALPVIEYAVIFPALGGIANVADLGALSPGQLIEQAEIGGSVAIQMLRGIELVSWWALAAMCTWVSWQTLEGKS